MKSIVNELRKKYKTRNEVITFMIKFAQKEGYNSKESKKIIEDFYDSKLMQ